MALRHSHISDEIASRAPRALRQAADIEPDDGAGVVAVEREDAGDGGGVAAAGRALHRHP